MWPQARPRSNTLARRGRVTRRSKALEEGEEAAVKARAKVAEEAPARARAKVAEELRPAARKRPGAQEALRERQVGASP